ncbi:MAG TPA: methyltransferase domain-containing protein [Candidatus Dormibacteraeota bacterium]|nr:methyltransferase domain-containing protein [Candidatus Dormibacteraeota bacterium]
MSTAPSIDDRDAQAAVDAFFDGDAPNWEAIYRRKDVFSVIHQQRQKIALDWVDTLRLSPATRVLEIGCGAGFVSIELARRGYEVRSVDSTSAMVELTRRNAKGAGVRISVAQADAHHLDSHPDGNYGLVLALGVIPWLHSPELAVAEVSRVLGQGGHLIVNASNRGRLHHLIDPLLTPALGPLRGAARSLLGGGKPQSQEMPAYVLHWPRQFDAMLARHHLRKMRARTFGFGPFSFWGRRLVSEGRSVRLHLKLQSLADRRIPGLRSTGAQYIVLAKKEQPDGTRL